MPKLEVPLEDLKTRRPAAMKRPVVRLDLIQAGGSLSKAKEAIEAKIVTPRQLPVVRDGEVVTHSEIDAWRQCPLKWTLGYKDRWSKEAREGSALHRGTAWHALMEEYYGVLAQYPARARAVRSEALWNQIQARCYPLLVDEDGFSSDQQVLLAWMLEGYWACYGIEEDWEVLVIESAGRMRLKNPETGAVSRFYFQFKIDLLVYDLRLKRLLLVDHKSAANFSRPSEIDIDDQFGLYTWALREMGVDVFGSVRSDARTQRNQAPMALDNRFRRVTTNRTDVELRNIYADLFTNARLAWSSKDGDRAASSPSPSMCSWRCDFLEVHLMARKGVPLESALKGYGFKQRGVKHDYYAPGDGGPARAELEAGAK